MSGDTVEEARDVVRGYVARAIYEAKPAALENDLYADITPTAVMMMDGFMLALDEIETYPAPYPLSDFGLGSLVIMTSFSKHVARWFWNTVSDDIPASHKFFCAKVIVSENLEIMVSWGSR